ncbi:MAG: HDOD domain-containing protein [Chitinivibrionales bacterium]|nr:HDOD domain-containing protein [Chitinivibrionales bacterium]
MRILNSTSSIKDLPTLPEIIFKVQRLANSDEADARAMAQAIMQDPPLAAKILKVANAAFYGPSNKRISSIQLAVARIGFNEVRDLVMAAELITRFASTSNVLDYSTFWKHSLTAGYLVQHIYEKSSVPYDKDVLFKFFMSGLLHDIGILVYDQFFHAEFEQVIQYAVENEISFLAAEHHQFPKETHPFAAGVLLELWKIDSEIIAAVRYHHEPEKAPTQFKHIVTTAALAEFILCNTALGSFEGIIEADMKKWCSELGVDPERLPDLQAAAEQEAAVCDMIIASSPQQKTDQLHYI